MKKFILILTLCLISFSALSKSAEWVELQAVTIPPTTVLNYTYKTDGGVRYFILVSGMSVTVSKNNAKKFLRGECRLELVKWYNKVTGKYKYTVREYKENRNIDLNQIYFEND